MKQSRIGTKRSREQALSGRMIALYCRKKHGHKALCPDCAALDAYVRRRSELCPYMAHKSFCLNCPSPCYRSDMREKIREVMRFSGPWMLLYRPWDALRHIAHSMRSKKKA